MEAVVAVRAQTRQQIGRLPFYLWIQVRAIFGDLQKPGHVIYAGDPRNGYFPLKILTGNVDFHVAQQ